MKKENLEYRYYKGEEKCPYAISTKRDGWRGIFWSQESILAKNPDMAEMAIEQYGDTPAEDMPDFIKKAKATDAERCVAYACWRNYRMYNIDWAFVDELFAAYFS